MSKRDDKFNQLYFNGYKVFSDATLVVQDGTKLVKRGFFEQLFSWTPFKAYKKVPNYVPSRKCFIDELNKFIVVHPIVLKELENVKFNKMHDNSNSNSNHNS
jgi:hypothetical protein